uniref:Serine hydroxymethyltransferase n=1 Tax=Hirondellea gigas TaxID=1518452 RepID=A0A6A7G3T1_9CRUS
MELKEQDPEVYGIIKAEEQRQQNGLELIASENFTSKAVMEAMGSCLTNKYSEGLPGARYYGGNEQIDKLEILCQNRALNTFGLDSTEWGVNVQSYSGSTANFSAFTALLEPNDRLMGLNLPSGGHLSHGYYRGDTKVNASAKYFQSLPYDIDPQTGLVDYDDLEKLAKRFRPKLLIAGGSAYPRDWNYQRMRTIADSVGAFLLTDMSHYGGLVASKCLKSPFEYSDVVTTTTHKSLRGPRAALIFFKKSLASRVNFAVFPCVQGGPHNHAIAAVSVQLKEASTKEFTEYSKQVISNAKMLGEILIQKKYKIVTDGTDTHLILWDLRPIGLTGSKLEALCDAVHITVNKNSVHGDRSAFSPGGVRIGTGALTSRGFVEKDFEVVAEFLDRCVQISKEIQSNVGKKLTDFKRALETNTEVHNLAAEVADYSSVFPMPGRIL